MQVREFLAQLGKAPPAAVYLFCPSKAGKTPSYEPFLVEQAFKALTDQYVDPSLRDLSYASYFADETPPAEIVDNAQTVPFLSEKKVVLVRRAEEYMTRRSPGALSRYIASPSNHTILAFAADAVDRRKEFMKACEKDAVIVESPQLQEKDVILWARAAVEKRGKNIDASGVTALVHRAGLFLSDVNNAVNQVCDFTGSKQSITRADVEKACSEAGEEDVWAMVDAIAKADTGEALRIYHRLVEPGKNEIQLLATINWMVKSAYGVAAGGEAAASVKGFTAQKLDSLAKAVGKKGIIRFFGLCMETDMMLRSTGAKKSLPLELLIIKLCNSDTRSQARMKRMPA